MLQVQRCSRRKTSPLLLHFSNCLSYVCLLGSFTVHTNKYLVIQIQFLRIFKTHMIHIMFNSMKKEQRCVITIYFDISGAKWLIPLIFAAGNICGIKKKTTERCYVISNCNMSTVYCGFRQLMSVAVSLEQFLYLIIIVLMNLSTVNGVKKLQVYKMNFSSKEKC